MDDPIQFLVIAGSPAVTCILAGNVLIIWTAFREHKTSRWGLRLITLGFALLHLIPGVLILARVATGHTQGPAVIPAVVGIAAGVAFLIVLRHTWNRRPAGSN